MILEFLLSVLLTMAMVMILIPIAHHFDLMANPGEHRGHDLPTPVTGGIAIYLSFLVVIRIFEISIPPSLLMALTVVLIFGIVDDRWTLPFWVRFVAQAAAIYLLVQDGVMLNHLGYLVSDEIFGLGQWSQAMSIFAMVGVINAINMIDGMDGLSGILVTVVLIGLMILVPSGSEMVIAPVCIVLSGCVAGFLIFNLRFKTNRPARVFLGDSGSMLLGVMISWGLVTGSQDPYSIFSPVVALFLVAIPLFDTVGVMLRRIFRGQSPFSADQLHTHHLLIRFGFTVNQALGIIAIVAVALAATGLLGHYSTIKDQYMFYLFLGLFVTYLVAMELGFRCFED